MRASLGATLYGALSIAFGLTDVPPRPRPYAITFELSAGFSRLPG
jgi:hypothetical protein